MKKFYVLALCLICAMGAKALDEFYAVLNGDVMTFYYDNERRQNNGSTDWQTDYVNSGVKKAVFDESTQDYDNISAYHMFEDFTDLEQVVNLRYIGSIYSANAMFKNCSSLRVADFMGIDMSRAYDATDMFNGCSSLTAIYSDDNWYSNSEWRFDDNMFLGCTSLVGGNGTAYDPSHVDGFYARPDEPGQPGYFTIYSPADELCDVSYEGQWKFKHSQILPAAGNGEMTLVFFTEENWYYDVEGASLVTPGEGMALFFTIQPEALDKLAGVYSDSNNKIVLSNHKSTLFTYGDGEKDYSDVTAGTVTIKLNATRDAYDLEYDMTFLMWGTNSMTFAGGIYGICVDDIDPKQGIDHVSANLDGSQKMIKDGQLLIQKNGKTFNATGAEVR